MNRACERESEMDTLVEVVRTKDCDVETVAGADESDVDSASRTLQYSFRVGHEER